MNTQMQVDEILTRGVSEVIDLDRLRARLLSGESLRIKFGIDPTSPNIHLGRAVSLLKLRDFQNLGHTIVFIVGDFTGVVGDTSDKESERPMLSSEAVHQNMRSYVEQAAKLLDIDKIEVHYNSEWLGKLDYNEIGEHADQFSVAEFIARDNIKKRLDAGKRVSLREMLYPLMQGYDSVAVEADVEIGGNDQRFNILSGRKLQAHYKQVPQDVLLTNLILGTDGRKMSSSFGNTINLLDGAQDMFGKIMSAPDDLIIDYLVHCTRVPMQEISQIAEGIVSGTLNPRDAKLRLAKEVIMIYHGADAADEAERYFIDTFSKKEIPQDVREVTVKIDEKYIDVLAKNGLAESKSDARRKIDQGGVSLEGEKLFIDALVAEGDDDKVLKVGKKDFVKIKVA
ncbi:MAG: tyrosine--tRNA ligase [Candidatus Moranbacteria bacterium]|nr:tyrosine--tRNA ligase [Candidatus Moranbacteria bacterium]